MFQSNTRFWDDLAIQSYKDLLKKDPSNPLIHKNLGLAYVRIKKDNKAIRSFQRAIKAKKDYAEAYYHLGTLYQSMGKKAEAIRCYNNYHKFEKITRQHCGVVDELVDQLKTEQELEASL